MRSRAWLTYALVTTVSWGLWGAFTGLPANHGFPETLIYAVWAVTMIPPALFALHGVGWRLQYDARSICYGALIGLLGAGGQMLLFHAVRTGPAYLIFPVISLSPVVTVVLSLTVLRERTGKLGALGIVLALCSLPLFDYSGSTSAGAYGQLWFLPALGVLVSRHIALRVLLRIPLPALVMPPVLGIDISRSRDYPGCPLVWPRPGR